MKDFLASRDKLGDTLYERTWLDIARVRVGCDLLICGYCGGRAHIFTVTNPTIDHPSFITYFDEPGFAAIGTGNMLAESTLFGFEQTRAASLENTIYQTTLAKFVAEAASDIGEITFVRAFDKTGRVMNFDPSLAMNLRERYMEKGKPRIPPDAIAMIEDGIEAATVDEPYATKALFQAAVKRWNELKNEGENDE